MISTKKAEKRERKALTVSTSRDAHYGVYVRGMKDSDWYRFLKVNTNQKIWSLDTTSSRLQ